MTSTSRQSVPPVDPGTIVDAFIQRAEKTPQRTAFHGLTSDGQWTLVNWEVFAQRVRRLAASFAAHGIGRGARVAICAATSINWEIAQMAALYAGASVVGLDPNYPDSLLTRLLADSRAQALVAQNALVLARFSGAALGALDLVATIEDAPPGTSSPVPTLHALAQQSGDIAIPPPQARPKDEAVIVHSSGTTGVPKTIPYRQDQLMIALQAILDAFPDIDENSTLVCWLPLSNLFQRMINFAAMMRGARSYIVDDPRSVMEHVRAARPDVFIGVPRFFEKVQAGIAGRIETGSPIAAFLGKQAIALGHRRAQASRTDTRPPLVVRALWPLADRWILARIRETFGGRLRYFISGSAPMPGWLLEWFEAIGLPVLEAYGVSENIVPMAANRWEQRRIGTVGKPMPAHEVTIAEDGEILVRGPGVAEPPSVGLQPDARTNDFLATGDLGKFDHDGFLRIVGRKADVFKSSTGKWIVPTDIEGRLARVPYIEHAVVSGAGRKATIAVVSVAASHTLAATADGEADRPDGDEEPVVERLRVDVGAALADLPSQQQLAGLLIVAAADLSVTGGELTTNLKVRRRHVERKFAAEIERLHAAIDRRQASQGRIVVLRARHAAVESA